MALLSYCPVEGLSPRVSHTVRQRPKLPNLPVRVPEYPGRQIEINTTDDSHSAVETECGNSQLEVTGGNNNKD